MLRALLPAIMSAVLADYSPAGRAQMAVPPAKLDPFKDTTPVRQALQPGERVLVYEFEDMECPACADAYPITHRAVDRFHVRLVRHDFPLPIHPWSRAAAVTARYLQDKASPETAEQFRHDVFARQAAIDSREDLATFTHRWFTAHNLPEPAATALGPDSPYAKEVQADVDLGKSIGLRHTPTIFVVSPKGWVEVVDVPQIGRVIEQAQAAGATPQGVHNNHIQVKSRPPA